MKHSEGFLQSIKFITDVLADKTQAKTLGKKWKGEIFIKANIYEGGITSVECDAVEKIKKKT
jgi:hypothetical protein